MYIKSTILVKYSSYAINLISSINIFNFTLSAISPSLLLTILCFIQPPSLLQLSHRPLSTSLFPGAHPDLCSALPCGVGAGRRLYGASLMHGYPTVRECEVDIMSVSCRWQLKYIIKEMHVATPYPCHHSPSGRQVAANLVNLCELSTNQGRRVCGAFFPFSAYLSELCGWY